MISSKSVYKFIVVTELHYSLKMAKYFLQAYVNEKYNYIILTLCVNCQQHC